MIHGFDLPHLKPHNLGAIGTKMFLLLQCRLWKCFAPDPNKKKTEKKKKMTKKKKEKKKHTKKQNTKNKEEYE